MAGNHVDSFQSNSLIRLPKISQSQPRRAVSVSGADLNVNVLSHGDESLNFKGRSFAEQYKHISKDMNFRDGLRAVYTPDVNKISMPLFGIT